MDYLEKRKFILTGDLNKVIGTLSFPVMLNNLAQTLYNLADTYWVSKVGSVQVAATSFVWPVNFLMIAIGIGISIAGTSIISQYIGSGDEKMAKLYAGQILSFSCVLSIVLMIIGYFSTPFIIKFMGAKGSLFSESCIYLRIMFLDILGMYLYFAFSAIRQAQGDTMSPMVISFSSVFINIVLDPIFIFKFDLGIAGAGIATVISHWAVSFYLFYILFFKKEGVYVEWNGLKLRKKLIKKIIQIGLPSSVGQSGSALGFIVLNMFIGYYGNPALAAFGIVNRINSLVMMPSMGIGSALSSIVGQNLGANLNKRAKQAFSISMRKVILFSVTGGGIIYLFAEGLVGIFVSDPSDIQVMIHGNAYLKIISMALPFIGMFNVFKGLFQGSGHTKYSMIMDMGRLWIIRLPMIIGFQKFTNLGAHTVWFSMGISNVMICIIGYFMYLYGKWDKKTVAK